MSGTPNKNIFLFSVESYVDGFPSLKGRITTIGILFTFLVFIEHLLRQVFTALQHLHPLLEIETNRNILARHIGVDCFSCFVIAVFGFKSRYIIQDLIDTVLHGKNSMPKAFENRMVKYYPEAQRLVIIFCTYQVKNTVDTIIWNDGLLFLFHHMFTILTTWGPFMRGTSHFYAVFYFGISELSTAILCLLANFDDDHGVIGLGSAFPATRAIIGVIFSVIFIIVRVLMWSTFSYYYCKDCWNILHSNDPRLDGTKLYFRFTGFSLAFLTFLQIIWLGEIGRIGKEELVKFGIF